jgi:hypothetical protein
MRVKFWQLFLVFFGRHYRDIDVIDYILLLNLVIFSSELDARAAILVFPGSSQFFEIIYSFMGDFHCLLRTELLFWRPALSLWFKKLLSSFEHRLHFFRLSGSIFLFIRGFFYDLKHFLFVSHYPSKVPLQKQFYNFKMIESNITDREEDVSEEDIANSLKSMTVYLMDAMRLVNLY